MVTIQARAVLLCGYMSDVLTRVPGADGFDMYTFSRRSNSVSYKHDHARSIELPRCFKAQDAMSACCRAHMLHSMHRKP